MNPYQSPTMESGAQSSPPAPRPWFFAKLFAFVGFVVGGVVVFYAGFRAFAPPPPPPGTFLCGNAVLGGFLLMVVGAPIAAIVSSLVALTIGGVVDCILRWLHGKR
jgi:hypothetical protein